LDQEHGAVRTQHDGQSPVGAKVTGIRFRTKRSGCVTCSGPCGTLGCRCTLEGPVSANHSTPDAADVLRAVAARLSSPAASSAPVETSSGVKRRHQAAHLGPDYDGRKKGARASHTLPRNFGQVPDWLRIDPKIGNIAVHASHIPHLAWHRGLTWCWSCGNYAVAVPNLLRKECSTPGTAGCRQLERFRKGQTPRNTVPWPLDEA
jgi:hypothetical protein